MSVPFARKKEMFDLLEQAYRLTDGYPMDCLTHCDGLCEINESMTLLPYEHLYIAERLGQKRSPFHLVTVEGVRFAYEEVGHPCPALAEDGITCTIWPYRPLDCRSFPVVPTFSLDDPSQVETHISDGYCPLAHRIANWTEFVEAMRAAWLLLAPRIPPAWKRWYNEQIASFVDDYRTGRRVSRAPRPHPRGEELRAAYASAAVEDGGSAQRPASPPLRPPTLTLTSNPARCVRR